MPNNYLLKKKEIRVRPPHSDFVNLQRPRQCAPTKEASSHQGCAADVAQTRQRLHAGSACCDHRARISSICRDLGNAHQRRRQAATKAAPPTSLKRGSSRMQTQFSASATGCKLRLLSLPRNPSATTALGFRQFAETSAMRTNKGGKQPPRLRRRRRLNASAIAMQAQPARAIWTALVAAPLRSWSPQHQRVRPHGSVRSSRMRPTKTLS